MRKQSLGAGLHAEMPHVCSFSLSIYKMAMERRGVVVDQQFKDATVTEGFEHVKHLGLYPRPTHFVRPQRPLP